MSDSGGDGRGNVDGADAGTGADTGDRAGFVEFGIDDRPPLGTSILLGLQHYLTMVGANIAVPLILAGAMGMPADATARFVGTFFVVSGVATLAQTTIGNRYPIVQGAPFSMLAPALAIIAVVGSLPGQPDWQAALVHLQGAIIAAAFVQIAIGYLGLIGRLRRFLSPVVIAPTIALIGLALFDAPQITATDQDWLLLGLTVGLIVLFSQYLKGYSRTFQLFPVILGMAIVWLLAAVLSVAGVYAPDSPGYVDFASIADAPAFMAIYPLQWGLPRFEFALAVGMVAGVLASIIESFGDYQAVASLTGSGAPSERRINHGIGMEGLMNVFSGLMGTGGSTSYSENIGAIGLTGVASRYVVQIGALCMLVVGFVGYFGQLVATIPDPIVGGLFVAMFGQIVAVGIGTLKHVDLTSQRNVFVVGFAMFVGLAIPQYMANVGSAQAFRELAAEITPVLGSPLFADTVFVIGGTGMAVGGLVALLLDNTIPGTREERGLEEWERRTEDDAEFESAWERWFGRGSTDVDRS